MIIMWLVGRFFFFFIILNIFNTHTYGEMREDLKKTYSGVYQKGPNSWIHSTNFKPFNSHSFSNMRLTHYFFLLRILNIFNTHTHGEGRRSYKNLWWYISKMV